MKELNCVRFKRIVTSLKTCQLMSYEAVISCRQSDLMRMNQLIRCIFNVKKMEYFDLGQSIKTPNEKDRKRENKMKKKQKTTTTHKTSPLSVRRSTYKLLLLLKLNAQNRYACD